MSIPLINSGWVVAMAATISWQYATGPLPQIRNADRRTHEAFNKNILALIKM